MPRQVKVAQYDQSASMPGELSWDRDSKAVMAIVGRVIGNGIVWYGLGRRYGIWDMGYGIWDMGYGISRSRVTIAKLYNHPGSDQRQ